MADPSLATRSPEVDAMEDEPLQPPIQTTTNTLPTPSEHCITDRPLPPGQQQRQPTGELTRYDDVETYISKPADYPSTPGRLLLLLTNGRGVHSVNNQLQADSFAQHGFVVVMPDMFAGDAAPNTTTNTATGEDQHLQAQQQQQQQQQDESWLDMIRNRVAETSKSFMIDMWLARHTAEKVLPIVRRALDRAKEEFADAVSSGGGVYAVGYCFGGKYVLTLAAERSDSVMQGQDGREQDVEAGMVRTGPEIKCGAVAHGTLVTKDDFVNIKAPVSLVCVENDPLFPEEVLEYGKKSFSTSKVEHEVTVYPDVPHGFAVVGEYESVTIREAQKAAASQLLNWLLTH